jgi:hypothetical protein
MTLTASDVQRFLTEPKATTSGRMRWTDRNLHVRMSRTPVEADGARVGELFLIANVALERAWTFKLLRRGEEVLRWDFTTTPYRHRNQRACVVAGLPKVVREPQHEHLWRPGAGTDCAEALPANLAALTSHEQVLNAFCERAIITLEVSYQPPPPTGEQLTLDEEP